MDAHTHRILWYMQHCPRGVHGIRSWVGSRLRLVFRIEEGVRLLQTLLVRVEMSRRE